jgi:hypothetical protein
MAPRKPREAPRAVKTNEKPTTKLMVWRTIYLRPGGFGVRADAPAMLATYTGTSGRMQGDRKDRIPAARAAEKVMLNIYISSIILTVIATVQ